MIHADDKLKHKNSKVQNRQNRANFVIIYAMHQTQLTGTG